jgi:hypothetical protein
MRIPLVTNAVISPASGHAGAAVRPSRYSLSETLCPEGP